MNKLTSESIMRLFRGEPIDRIPVSTRIAPNFTRKLGCEVDIVECVKIYRRLGWTSSIETARRI